MEQFKVMVVKEHPMVSKFFPLGFETTYRKVLSEKDEIVEPFYTDYYFMGDEEFGGKKQVKLQTKKIKVEGKTIPKGNFIDAIFIAVDGTEICGEWFYKMTGRPFAEFFEKI